MYSPAANTRHENIERGARRRETQKEEPRCRNTEKRIFWNVLATTPEVRNWSLVSTSLQFGHCAPLTTPHRLERTLAGRIAQPFCHRTSCTGPGRAALGGTEVRPWLKSRPKLRTVSATREDSSAQASTPGDDGLIVEARSATGR